MELLLTVFFFSEFLHKLNQRNFQCFLLYFSSIAQADDDEAYDNSLEKRSKYPITLISLNGNRPLAEEISEIIGVPLAEARISKFSDGEVSLTNLFFLKIHRIILRKFFNTNNFKLPTQQQKFLISERKLVKLFFPFFEERTSDYGDCFCY